MDQAGGDFEDPTPPDTRAAQLPDDPEDDIFPPPEDAVEVTPPVDVVTIDHAEAGLEPPQVYEVDVPDEPVTVLEVERKLRVHGLFRLPDLTLTSAGVSRAKRQITRTMTAVYHDTDDLRLARWGSPCAGVRAATTRAGISNCRSRVMKVPEKRCGCRSAQVPPVTCRGSSPSW